MNKEIKLTDYENGLQAVSDIPKFHLGQEVETVDGKGIIVKMYMDWNGLYISPQRSKVVVWFSTCNTQSKWVNASYCLSEIKAIVNNTKNTFNCEIIDTHYLDAAIRMHGKAVEINLASDGTREALSEFKAIKQALNKIREVCI